MKISIIITISNDAEYLESTLHSIANQSFQDFEVIVSGVGSPDHFLAVAEQFAQEDERIHCIATAHRGVAVARNNALETAQGEFLQFISGHDVIPDNGLKYMFQISNVNPCDVIVGYYEELDGDKRQEEKKTKKLCKKTDQIQKDDMEAVDNGALFNKWVRRSLIQERGLRFDESTASAETDFLSACLQATDRIYACPHSICICRKILQKPTEKTETKKKGLLSLLDRSRKRQEPEELKQAQSAQTSEVVSNNSSQLQQEVSLQTSPKRKSARKKRKSIYYNAIIDEHAVLLEGISMSPKGSILYLLRELSRGSYDQYKLYVSVREETIEATQRILARNGLDHVVPVLVDSDEYMKCLFSVKYLFNEAVFPIWWIKKPGQVYTNIWHGTPLKKLGKKKENEKVHRHANADRNFTMADYMLFPSDYAREHILTDSEVEDLCVGCEIRLGYPRTGVLFDPEISAQVRKKCMQGVRQAIAWMPTWRESFDGEVIKYFLKEMDQRLEEGQVLFVNLHHRTGEQISYDNFRRIRPFPEEFDTYELLSSMDVLVTDYSSVFYDFAVTRRKIILYCPDAEEYSDLRGLYVDLQRLPFPIAYDIDQLLHEIQEPIRYDDEEFIRTYNSRDSIRNTQRLCEIVFQGIQHSEDVERITKPKEDFTLLFSDGFCDETVTEQLYALQESGMWSEDIFLSFHDRKTEANKSQAYPLLYKVPTYSTSGRPMDDRSERQRLFHDICFRLVILLDTEDPDKIRCFSRFRERTMLCITERLFQKLCSGEDDYLKAVKTFARNGDGMFTFSETIADELKERVSLDVHHVTSLAEVLDGSFLQEKKKEYKID